MKQPDRTLVAALDPFLTEHGFKFLKARNAFIRKTGSGFEEFLWGSYPLVTGEKWSAGYYGGFYGVGLRNDEIQEIWNVLGLSYGGDPKKHRGTIFRAVGADGNYFAFDKSRDRELYLRFDHLEEDVAETAARIQAMLETDGWAWYSRYADSLTLSRDINDPIGGTAPHSLINNITQRPLVGIAAACVGEPERVPDLSAAWLAAIGQWDARHAGERSPIAPDFAAKFALLTARARELGHPV